MHDVVLAKVVGVMELHPAPPAYLMSCWRKYVSLGDVMSDAFTCACRAPPPPQPQPGRKIHVPVWLRLTRLTTAHAAGPMRGQVETLRDDVPQCFTNQAKSNTGMCLPWVSSEKQQVAASNQLHGRKEHTAVVEHTHK